jgi:hypothetical protein
MFPLVLFSGYKTWAGLVLFGIGAALDLAGMSDVGKPVQDFGGILAGIGSFHKLVKKE